MKKKIITLCLFISILFGFGFLNIQTVNATDINIENPILKIRNVKNNLDRIYNNLQDIKLKYQKAKENYEQAKAELERLKQKGLNVENFKEKIKIAEEKLETSKALLQKAKVDLDNAINVFQNETERLSKLKEKVDNEKATIRNQINENIDKKEVQKDLELASIMLKDFKKIKNILQDSLNDPENPINQHSNFNNQNWEQGEDLSFNDEDKVYSKSKNKSNNYIKNSGNIKSDEKSLDKNNKLETGDKNNSLLLKVLIGFSAIAVVIILVIKFYKKK